MIQDHDDPILEHLSEVKANLTNEPMVNFVQLYSITNLCIKNGPMVGMRDLDPGFKSVSC